MINGKPVTLLRQLVWVHTQ